MEASTYTPNPITALLLFVVVLAVGYVLFRLSRTNIFQSREKRRKTVIEDILKQLYHVEYSGHTTSLNGLSGALKISHKKLVDLIESMANRKLVKVENDRLQLTEDGREYALRIVRVHRLWEKYLSEETGIEKSEWHQRAEAMEHKLTAAEIEDLSRQLGNPRFDPHGDPIPTRSGEIVDTKWHPLSGFDEGKTVRIVHVEDEPEVIYKQILKMNLRKGQILKVIENNNDQLTLESEGESFNISSIVASNINADELTVHEINESNGVRLTSLEHGEKARILDISSECRGAARRRLLDLGFIKNSTVEIGLPGPLVEPKAYLIRNTMIALRNNQADLILIEKLTGE